ncbi:MAG: DUF6491 family protein [Wenzhouxiangella sp.]
MKMATVWVAAAILLAGCATGGETSERARIGEIYLKHTGSQENYVRYTQIRNWQSAGYDGIVVELDGGRHYFVGLTGPCDFDLRSAPMIKLVSAQRHRLSTFDKVYIGDQYCNVTGIQKIDMDAVEADLERMRAADAEPDTGEVEIEVDPDSDTSA